MVGTDKKVQNKYYSLKGILSKKAQYNIIIGERSNGKTFACIKYALEKFCKTGKQVAILRRWQTDLKGARASSLFSALESPVNYVEKLTGGEYTHIHYYGSRWYLAVQDEKTKAWKYDKARPFAFKFTLSEMEHDKSTSYPDVTTIIFDEFLTRTMYLPDEFILFQNCLSTIIRQRKDVTIFMLGNTVNKYCPYFAEMGLKNVTKMKQGTIDVYNYGDSGLKVALEFCSSIGTSKESNVYFAFNNPHLQMIKTGEWELDLYPHLPVKYKNNEILFTYFIVFNDEILQAEIVQHEQSCFTYIHRKTTPIQNHDLDIIYSLEASHKPNYYVDITNPRDKLSGKITKFFQSFKVFYQDNEVGEIVRNYAFECQNVNM